MFEKNLKFHSSHGKRTILIVEDEAINRELLGMLLEDDYDLLYAESGTEALRQIDLHGRNLNLVLLDLNLPDMKGQEILQRLKADTRTALLPVIVMTADQESEVECLNLGAIDFIPKPYPQQKVILARIRRTIELSEDRDIIRWTERDTLTGLYNPEYFYRYADQFDQYHMDTATDAVVVDINHFHMLNERYGRSAGDEVLKQVAQKLLEAVQDSEGIVCRREADTFLIYCPHRTDYKSLLGSACVMIGDNTQVRLRLGLYSDVDKSLDMERRFDHAKLAADTVRNNFVQNIAVYDDSMREKEMFEEQLLDGFRAAILEKQFQVHYQPKFDVRPREPKLHSAEALVRWKHPELGMISPGIFIPLFEKNGLIQELDAYVWKEAAAGVRDWKSRLAHVIPVSVNVSRIDLYDPGLPAFLLSLTEENGLCPEDILLEITESAYTENSEQIIAVVKELRENGFHIEMDDFGAGYSSLNMIGTLPLDTLKLDIQFIRNAFRERKDTRLLEAVIGLAKSLNLPTIAEGVETAEQMFTLKSMGCDIVQGYYFSRPLPPAEFEDYVRNLDYAEKEAENLAAASRKGPQDRYTYDALHDPLTGLYNHSAFDILFHDSDHDHIAVMIAHVDDYETIRKTQGKAGADQVVKRIAEVMKRNFRSVDNICRLQEAEFVIIMSRMTSSMQEQLFDKIDQLNRALKTVNEGELPVSLSFGIAFSDRENPQGDVFRDADTALKHLEQTKQRGFVVY